MKDPKRCWEGRRGAGKDRKATVAGTEEVMVGKERCRQGPESYRGLDRRGCYGKRGAGKDRKATVAGTEEVLVRKKRCREGPRSYRGRDGRGDGREGGIPGRTGKLQWPGQMRCWEGLKG